MGCKGGWGLPLGLESEVRWAPCLLEVYADGWPVSPGKELQEEIGRPHSIRGDEKEVHWICSKPLQIKEPENPTGRGKGRICAYLGWEIKTSMMTKAGSL